MANKSVSPQVSVGPRGARAIVDAETMLVMVSQVIRSQMHV